jgi:hypothetical protein
VDGRHCIAIGFYYDNLSASPIFPGYLQLLGFSLPLVNSPVLYLYIRSLAIGAGFRWKDIVIHLLPFFVFNGATFFLYYSKHDYLFLKNGFPHFSDALNPGVAYSITALLALIPGYYSVLSLLVLLKHQKSLPENYS